jgi:hypothetical protein
MPLLWVRWGLKLTLPRRQKDDISSGLTVSSFRDTAGKPESGNPTHAYPSSSRKQHNWDAIVKSSAAEDEALAKEFSKDPNAGGDKALNEMFQQLYAGATDEQRRAMVKSYQESNGTALSTDWKDVSKVRCLYFPLLR